MIHLAPAPISNFASYRMTLITSSALQCSCLCLYDCFVDSVRNREPTARPFTLDGIGTLQQKQLAKINIKSRKNPASGTRTSDTVRGRKDNRGKTTPASNGSSQQSGSRVTRSNDKSALSEAPGRKQAAKTEKSNNVHRQNSPVSAVTSVSGDRARHSAKSKDGSSAVHADSRPSKSTSVTHSSRGDAGITTANSSESHSHDLRSHNSAVSSENNSGDRVIHGAKSKDGSSAVSTDSRAPKNASVAHRSSGKNASKSTGNGSESNSNDTSAGNVKNSAVDRYTSSAGVTQQSIAPTPSSEAVVLEEQVSNVSDTGSRASATAVTSRKTLSSNAASTRTQSVTQSSQKTASNTQTASSSKSVANAHNLTDDNPTVNPSSSAVAPSSEMAAAVNVGVMTSGASNVASRSNTVADRTQSASGRRRADAAAVTNASAVRYSTGLEKIMIFNKKSKKSDFFHLNQIFLI